MSLGPTGQKALETLLAQQRGHVGIQMLNLTRGLRGYFGVDEGVGVLVAETNPGGPASRAGLRAGDVIVGLDDAVATSAQQVADLIGSRAAATVQVRYVRDGKTKKAAVEVEQHRSVVVKLSPSIVRQRVERSGQDGAEKVVTFEHRVEGGGTPADLDLVLQELSVFFSGDGFRRKLDRLEELDLNAMEERIKILESELVALEQQLPKAPQKSAKVDKP